MGRCRCKFNCGAESRCRSGCSCVGGKSHRCLGGGDPADIEAENKKKENEKENKKPTEKKDPVTVNVIVNINVNATAYPLVTTNSYACILRFRRLYTDTLRLFLIRR